MQQASRPIASLIADLKRLPATVERELRSNLHDAVEPIIEDARSRAGWSRRIPGAIGSRIRFSRNRITVSIRVNAKKAPHARPIEHKGKDGNFRHPVHADPTKTRDQWKWVPQRARPFLRPAAEANVDQSAARAADVIVKVVRQHGWR